MVSRASLSWRTFAGQSKRSMNRISSGSIVGHGLASASQQLSAASQEISSGAQEQASNLEETASSLEEITSTVKQNADNAQQANQLASRSREVAEKGGQLILTDGDYADFRLILKSRLVSEGNHLGVCFWGDRMPDWISLQRSQVPGYANGEATTYIDKIAPLAITGLRCDPAWTLAGAAIHPTVSWDPVSGSPPSFGRSYESRAHRVQSAAPRLARARCAWPSSDAAAASRLRAALRSA